MKSCFIDNNGIKCLTKNTKDGGPAGNTISRGKPCQLPWTDPWINQTHQGCGNPNNEARGTWCPTKINDGKLMLADYEKGLWGICNDKCLAIGKS